MTTPMWLIAAGFAVGCTGVFAWVRRSELREFNWRTQTKWTLGVGIAASLGLLGAGLFFAANDEANACTASGGRMVPSGPPVYIMSGNVLVPIQNYECETP